MSAYKPGDIVSRSRAQATRFTVTAPAAPDEAFEVTLPINGTPRTFSVAASPPATAAQAAALLVAELQNAQTVYAVAIDDAAPAQFVALGRRGHAFDSPTTPNIAAVVEQAAAQQLSADGSPERDLIVVVSENAFFAMTQREFYTRDSAPGAETFHRNVVLVRELDTGHSFEVDATSILTVISRANPNA